MTREALRLTRSVSAAALDLLIPARCAVCGDPGSTCCPECFAELERARPFAHGPRVYALARYDGAARRLVLAYKERGRRDLAAPLGRVLATGVPRLPEVRRASAVRLWLVPVPSRRSAARARGGQHVRTLARRCAAGLAERGVTAGVAPALRLGAGARDAVGLTAPERAANLRDTLRPVRSALPSDDAPVVLLDDVVTTGATLAACARVLRAEGLDVTAALALTGARSRRGGTGLKPESRHPHG